MRKPANTGHSTLLLVSEILNFEPKFSIRAQSLSRLLGEWPICGVRKQRPVRSSTECYENLLSPGRPVWPWGCRSDGRRLVQSAARIAMAAAIDFGSLGRALHLPLTRGPAFVRRYSMAKPASQLFDFRWPASKISRQLLAIVLEFTGDCSKNGCFMNAEEAL